MNNKIKMLSIVFEHTQRKLIIFLIPIRFLSEVFLPIAKKFKRKSNRHIHITYSTGIQIEFV